MAKIIDIIRSEIRYEGDNTSFVWKHPCEDFNTNSQLIVPESQEAVLFLNGQACDTFGPGCHTLTTNNIQYPQHNKELTNASRHYNYNN